MPHDRRRSRKSRDDKLAEKSRANHSGRPNPKADDFFAVAMRRMGTGDTARNVFDQAPKVGADSLVALHQTLWQAIYQVGTAYKHAVAALKKAGADPEDLAFRSMEFTKTYGSLMNRLIGAGVTLNSAHLKFELDTAETEMNITTDDWRGAMAGVAVEELQKQLSALQRERADLESKQLRVVK